MEIIRVHTGEGRVYARKIEVTPPPVPGMDPMYIVGDQVEVPEGLSQQEAADHFRAQGWTVEQDIGVDFDHPEWEDETMPGLSEPVPGLLEVPDCVLCGGPLEPWPTPPGEIPRGWGNNPEPLAKYDDGRACDECNQTRVIPARMGALRGKFGLGKGSLN